jgi:hypothetical protein
MTTLFKLKQHLMALLVEDKICFEDGDWDHLAKIRWAIDDTRDQIKSFEASFNYDAPYNSEFLGAQPAKAGEDY